MIQSIKNYYRRIFRLVTSGFLHLFVICSAFLPASAQATLRGKVVEWDEGMKMEMPLPGANVYWLGTQMAASTDAKGEFNIPEPAVYPAMLVVSFVGYRNDTLEVQSSIKTVKAKLAKSLDLKEIEVKGKLEAVGISMINPINVEKITQKEILKAACCNLSEAFETSPTVNVSYKDAVTGAKEIQLLGLSGIYSQLMTENIPNMRGIAGIYGLTYIPGPWMESIQVTKGTGSVLNGYESTTGQLNVEFKKPQDKTTPRFFLNLFGEESGNAEINSFFRHKFNSKWSTVMMTHASYMDRDVDGNGDGFMDMPHSKQVNLYNRWQYQGGKKTESQLGIKFLVDEKEGGQIHASELTGTHPYAYRTLIRTMRAEAFGKLGFVYANKPFKSIGNIVQVTYHDMNSSFGMKSYVATQKTLYVQSIYQNILWKSNQQYKFGVTYRYDQLDQSVQSVPANTDESVPGIFAEYTYNHLDKLTLIAGAREDFHKKYGWEFTPRFHGKYNFSDNFLTRISGGRSFRIPYLYAENLSVFASSKTLRFNEMILPERAWNYGLNFTWKFLLNQREGSLAVDFYRTDFINQAVMDAYSDSSFITFYNLKGKSYANSFQIMFNYEVLERLNLRLAYKLDDVMSTYQGKLEEKPLVSRVKALVNLAYQTGNEHWKFDYTAVLDGPKKLETTYTDAAYGRTPEFSPQFLVMHLQVTKVFRRFEVYAGSENLLDYRQEHPIVNPSDPFGNAFDAINIWGPIEGRRIYAGLRYQIL